MAPELTPITSQQSEEFENLKRLMLLARNTGIRINFSKFPVKDHLTEIYLDESMDPSDMIREVERVLDLNNVIHRNNFLTQVRNWWEDHRPKAQRE